MLDKNGLTIDTFFNGSIQVKQYRAGYRFSIDAVLLACHARPGPGDRVLDLGTGCGIIPLILAFRHPQILVYGIEVQKELSDLAGFNVMDNHMQERITILGKDMKSLKPEMISGFVDLVVCNPPYRRSDSGRLSRDRQRAGVGYGVDLAPCWSVMIVAARFLARSRQVSPPGAPGGGR